MRNIKLTIQYDGTNYAGWQFQKNARSIQEVLESALRKISGEKVSLIGSGRTDAGVHARGQIANFRTRSRIPLKNMKLALNSELPDDIVISAIEEAGPKFNAQHDAKLKLYRYTIVNDFFLDPFIRNFALRYFISKLDVSIMRKAAKAFLGRRDFNSLRTNDAKNTPKGTIRTIKKIKIAKRGRIIYIDIEADGFLYNMVRNIAGTLIEVGRGKIQADSIKEMLRKKDRRFCGPTAPAKGLCLVKVTY